jgi:hypothetical protein
MTRKEAIPVVLVMFTLVCALPATVISPPSAIAQEDDEAENLASDTVSNVLDNVNTAGDNTNTQLSVPITDLDQTDANLGLSEALDVTVERTLSTPTTPPPSDDDGEQPPEEPPAFVWFCLVSTAIPDPLCFNTSEQCEIVEERIGEALVSDCEGVEELPSNALICVIQESGTIQC